MCPRRGSGIPQRPLHTRHIHLGYRQQLRSTTTGTLLVPRARTTTEQRSFAINGPTTSNSLPPAPDLSQNAFKRALKTSVLNRPAPLRLFRDSGAGCKYFYLLTYLLTYLLSASEVDTTGVYLHFVAYLLPFMTFFRTDEPLVHVLYEKVNELTRACLQRF